MEELSLSSSGIVSEIVGKERWGELKKRNEEKVIASIRTRIEDVCNETNQSQPECSFIVQRIIVKTGHPVDQIIHYAEKKECDMVVMGSSGHGILFEAMLGIHRAEYLEDAKSRFLSFAYRKVFRYDFTYKIYI